MNANNCIPQRFSKFMLGVILMIGAAALVISGFTVLPVIGFIIAVPFFALGIFFLRSHLDDHCEIRPA